MDNIFNTTYYLFSIAAVVVIIILAYFTTLFIAKKSNNFLGNKHARIIEKTSLGVNLGIIVVQIHNKVYILLQSHKTMELLDVIDKEEWFNYSCNDSLDKAFNEQAIIGVNKIKDILASRRKDIKGEDDKNRSNK